MQKQLSGFSDNNEASEQIIQSKNKRKDSVEKQNQEKEIMQEEAKE